jgi:hypothetical protein
MPNRPDKNYDYTRPGVAMLTLKACPRMRLCRITQSAFALTETGRIVQKELLGIHDRHEQIKIGQYQIMPDHLHVLMHVTRPLPPDIPLQRVIRGFKLGVNRIGRETTGAAHCRVFEKGMNDRPIFHREHLQREAAYIRDNVRRYRLRQAHPDLFRKAAAVMTLPDGVSLWGIGNLFLLQHPQRMRVQISRRADERDWPAMAERVARCLEQGGTVVSPFISPFERRVLHAVVVGGGRAIRLTHNYFGERYKPSGELFDLCCAGRLLEISVAGEFARYARLDRAACLKLNEIARHIAPTPL